jgi:hypothetical protein
VTVVSKHLPKYFRSFEAVFLRDLIGNALSPPGGEGQKYQHGNHDDDGDRACKGALLEAEGQAGEFDLSRRLRRHFLDRFK